MTWTPDINPHTTEYAVICQALQTAHDTTNQERMLDIAQGLEEYLHRNQRVYSLAKKLYELTGYSEYPFEQLRTEGPYKTEHNESYQTWMNRAQELLVWLHR